MELAIARPFDEFDPSEAELDVVPIPPKPGPTIFIWRLKAKEKDVVHVFSKSLFGINVHYGANSERSSPHYKQEDKCEGCRRKVPIRWKGFLHCWAERMRQQVFLELTPGSAKMLLTQQGNLPTLRGCLFEVERKGAANGRLIINLKEVLQDTSKMPPEVDPLPTLKILWGIDEKKPRVFGYPGEELPVGQ